MKLPPIRPGRLFWKLFAAFTLAIISSFLIGIVLAEWMRPNAAPVVPAFETPVRIAELIQTQGVEAARPMIAQNEPYGRMALTTAQGEWIAGDRSITAAAPSMSVRAPDGALYALRVRPSDPFDPNLVMPMVIGALVALLFSAGVAWYLARPLTHLSGGLKQAAAGELGTRLHPLVGSRRDEIADLTREFDGMATQLQELLSSQQRLLHDVSHELRSPLARLQVAIGLLRQSPDDREIMEGRVEREAERLNQLIEELLTLSRLKSGMSELNSAPVDVIDLLAAIVDDANFEGGAKNCTVDLVAPDSFITLADGELLYRAYENIIRNAVKFSPHDAVVRVNASLRNGGLLVEVEDSGPGVPADLIDRIFDPFQRFDGSDQAGPTGFGLGLAISKFAVEKHQGSLVARRRGSQGGLIFEILIPYRAIT